MEREAPWPRGYEAGCFVRTCWWPEDEIASLARRERGEACVPPGRATFVRRGVPGRLRGTELGYEDCTQLSYTSFDLGDAFGLVLRAPPHRPVEWFFTGVGKTGPDDVEWVAGRRYDNGSGSYHQTWNVTPPSIVEILDELRDRLGRDKLLPVNEALLDYRVGDIVALVVDPRSVKSIARAAGFLKGVLRKTEAEVGFYSYDANAGDMHLESLEALTAQKHCKSFRRKYRDYANFYEILWDKAAEVGK